MDVSTRLHVTSHTEAKQYLHNKAKNKQLKRNKNYPTVKITI